MKYNVARAGVTYGPYTANSLHQMVGEGSLLPDDLISPSNQVNWKRAGEIVELFPVPRASTLATAIGTSQRPAVIERTSKRFKGMMLIGALMFLVGLFSLGDESRRAGPLLLLGVVIYVTGRIAAWWHHG